MLHDTFIVNCEASLHGVELGKDGFTFKQISKAR